MSEPSAPGPLALFHRYLQQRAPAALAAHAFVAMVGYIILSHLWTSAADATPMRRRSEEAEGLFAASVHLPTVLQSLSTLFYYIAIFLLVWAAARLLAEAVRGRMNAER